MASQVLKFLCLFAQVAVFFASAETPLKRGELVKSEQLTLWESSKKAVNMSKAQMRINPQEFPTKSRVDAFRITFATVNHKSEIIQSTGLVQVPAEIEEAVPFVSYLHATRMLPSEAPSALMFDPEAQANAIIYSSRCCIVTMPDYLGLDKKNELPQFYLNAEIQARVAYDLIVATKSFLTSIHKKYKNEVLIAGYSQGAHNALGLHKYIQMNHAKELKVLGTSAMSGPYSVSQMTHQVLDKEVKIKINPVFVGLAIFGMHEAYDSFPRLTELLQPKYAAELPSLIKKGKFSEIRNALPKDVDALFDLPKVLEIIDEEDDHPFWQALIKNDVDTFKPNAPVLMIHSQSDKVIPISTAEASYQRLKALGAHIEFVKIDKADCDHLDAAFPALLRTARFFNTRLN